MTELQGSPDTPTARGRDHDLPMLRVHRAWEAAAKVGAEYGVTDTVAVKIASEVIGIIGGGTRRWGHLCTQCRSQLTTTDGRLECPEHGPLGTFTPASLLISFEPLAADHDG